MFGIKKNRDLDYDWELARAIAKGVAKLAEVGGIEPTKAQKIFADVLHEHMAENTGFKGPKLFE